MAKRGPKTPMTDEHKAALATGRAESRAVRAYLEALRHNRRRRGRKRTAETIQANLSNINAQLADADPITELKLLQQRRNLTAELAALQDRADHADLEGDFVAVAASYATRNNIDYATWREVGVEASVLAKAGISR